MDIKIIEFILLIAALIWIGVTYYGLYQENSILSKVNNLTIKHNNTIKTKLNQVEEENKKLEEKLINFEETNANYNKLLGEHEAQSRELEELKTLIDESTRQLIELKAIHERTKSLQEALKEKDEFSKKIKEEMSREFKNLSSELFESKSKSMQESNNENIKHLLKPFNSELKSFKERLESINREQNQSVSMLRGELLQIKELNKSLSNEAQALAKALKGEAKVQGNWGEMILERALEASGLREGKEYKKEQTFNDENGKLRADVVLYLPEDKHIVIDAKVSLNAYSDMLKAQTQEEQNSAKQRHIISIKRHIDTLASKQYHMLSELKAPEFTLMFIPIEAAYLMALEIDNALYEYAFERNVAVVTPTTLLTTLKTVSTLWKLANHDKNMLLLAQEAGSLHDKFALFLEEFTQIENRLTQAQNAYTNAKNRLKDGNGSLHSKIEKIGKLSGKSKKLLPSSS